jgi:hypothetical protein
LVGVVGVVEEGVVVVGKGVEEGAAVQQSTTHTGRASVTACRDIVVTW